MNRRTLLVGFGGLLALSALPALAQDKTYTLQPKYTAGEMTKYKFSMNMLIKMKDKEGKAIQIPGLGDEGMRMKMGGTLIQKTKTVKPDGSATLSSQLRGGTMEMMGQTNEIPSGPESTTEVDKAGKVLKTTTPQQGMMMANPFMGMMQMDKISSMGMVYPDKPIKVGDMWEQELPGMAEGTMMKVKNEVVALEQLGGKETLRIKQTISIPFDMSLGPDGKPTKEKKGAAMKGSMTTETFYNLNTEDARIVRTSGTIKGGMTMQLPEEAAQQSPFGTTLNMDMEGTMGQTLLSIGKISDDVAPKKVTPPTKPAAKPTTKGKKKH